MEAFMQETAFRVYAAVSAVLIVKIVLLNLVAGILRKPKGAWINEEDANGYGGEVKSDPTIDRINRASANASVNIIPFVVLGLLYVLVGASGKAMQIYAYTFFFARVLHTVSYLAQKNLSRTLGFVVGALCLIGMSFQVGMRVFNYAP